MRLAQVLPRLRTDLPRAQVVSATFLRARKRFKALKKLGQGAFGAAWSARLGKQNVIVKAAVGTPGLVSPQEAVESLRRESVILGKLQKFPFVPRLIEVGIDYFVMEDVQGISLLNLLVKGLEPRELLASVVATGIIASVLHNEGIAHNDLEARNILLTPMGVVVIDFGIAVDESRSVKDFKRAMERDLVALMEDSILVISSKSVPKNVKIMVVSTVEKFRKKIVGGRINTNTAREFSRELLFALAQLNARAKRGNNVKREKVRVIAV